MVFKNVKQLRKHVKEHGIDYTKQYILWFAEGYVPLSPSKLKELMLFV